MQRPKLTLPPQEADAVAAAYAEALVILEYGSGGSTALAAELPGKTVFSVESDAVWLEMMRSWFASAPPAADVVLHHSDIGPTKEWGYPADWRSFYRWPGYASSVWERSDFRHPDVVLIDGRFRVACFLTLAAQINRSVHVLFDDYTDRPEYHRVERIQKPYDVVGRMARFWLEPQRMSATRRAERILSGYIRR